ncbi:MAG: type II toxin-antitoxin system HigB family toxin [Candidatus Tectomicrobia bacterium]|nr:type II toxin-antitoxin system HigB family toxin [Candidatus Tectomicrobia bacterium]
MRIIKPATIRQFISNYPDAQASLEHWLEVVRHAEWSGIHDLRESLRSADPVSITDDKTVTVFNISGNKYRLITSIYYNTHRVYILLFMTHAEYSRDRRKGLL